MSQEKKRKLSELVAEINREKTKKIKRDFEAICEYCASQICEQLGDNLQKELGEVDYNNEYNYNIITSFDFVIPIPYKFMNVRHKEKWPLVNNTTKDIILNEIFERLALLHFDLSGWKLTGEFTDAIVTVIHPFSKESMDGVEVFVHLDPPETSQNK